MTFPNVRLFIFDGVIHMLMISIVKKNKQPYFLALTTWKSISYAVFSRLFQVNFWFWHKKNPLPEKWVGDN
jgi:hypothetical protein